ncbi:MAG: hypothetical protein K6F14_01570 [Clostridiales bacterium]|nr:hypothetical protein [Clostridiales bacterium]
MTSIELLSPLVRGLFEFWALMLCLSTIVGTILAIQNKRYVISAFSVILFVPEYLMEQTLFDLSLFEKTGAVSAVTQAVNGLPYWLWLSACIIFTGLSVLLISYNIHYEKTFITPDSIKAYLDQIPCGICCWQDNGRVLFSNVCMNSLCMSLTGEPLLNGNQFRNALTGEMAEVEGKKWRFSYRETVLNGEHLHDLIASDITEEYSKTLALEKDRAELSRITRELRDYSFSIDETVRHQEILEAKVNIHNEMNRLMLSSMAAESEDPEALDNILSLWEQNALLLCREAGEAEENRALSRIESLAEALKIRLIWEQNIPDNLSETQRSLFFSAAQEAVSNASKHAGASELRISFESDGSYIHCSFTNDGKVGNKDIPFSGGLGNLLRLAEKQNAKVSVKSGDNFVLSLSFPIDTLPHL